jgi:hypothetical protein
MNKKTELIIELASELVEIIMNADAVGDEEIQLSDVIEIAVHLGSALEAGDE